MRKFSVVCFVHKWQFVCVGNLVQTLTSVTSTVVNLDSRGWGEDYRRCSSHWQCQGEARCWRGRSHSTFDQQKLVSWFMPYGSPTNMLGYWKPIRRLDSTVCLLQFDLLFCGPFCLQHWIHCTGFTVGVIIWSMEIALKAVSSPLRCLLSWSPGSMH